MWRSEDEMLEVVRERAARVRGRRRVVGTGVAGAVVLLCAAAAVIVRLPGDGRGPAQLQVAASGMAPTSVPSVDTGAGFAVPVPTTVTSAPPTPTSAVPTTVVAATTGTTAPSGAAAAVETTTVPGTIPVDRPVTTSTVASAPLPPCTSTDGVATAKVDKVTYVPGQPVTITGTLQNVSGRACGSKTSGSTIDLTNAAGVRVFGLGVSSHVDCAPGIDDCQDSLPAGGTEPAGACWDQTDMSTHAQVPTGTYTVKISWTGPIATTASTSFQIVPDPAAPTTTAPPTRCP